MENDGHVLCYSNWLVTKSKKKKVSDQDPPRCSQGFGYDIVTLFKADFQNFLSKFSFDPLYFKSFSPFSKTFESETHTKFWSNFHKLKVLVDKCHETSKILFSISTIGFWYFFYLTISYNYIICSSFHSIFTFANVYSICITIHTSTTSSINHG